MRTMSFQREIHAHPCLRFLAQGIDLIRPTEFLTGVDFEMSPVPDTQDANSSSVVVASPPASVPVSPAEERAEADAKRQGSVLMENPYLAGLSKKTRGLKKKMEKIKKTESLRASGKVRVWFLHVVGRSLRVHVC